MPLRRLSLKFLATAGAVVVAASLVVAVDVTPAGATSRSKVTAAAANYGEDRGYDVAVAVLDAKTGQFYGSGSYDSTFASESVAKTMIATRLLLQGRMHGRTADRAYTMITRSDDAIASSFYPSVGGDTLITWIKKHYHLPDLGSPPRRAGWWGNTHITARGLVEFYAKIKNDRKVGPWLINAMRHARRYGSDGTYQFFGLPSATSGAAIKQGWGDDYDDWGRSADFNSTGFIDGSRYAVAILVRGPAKSYGSKIAGVLTRVARTLLPGGRFPDAVPAVTSLSVKSGPRSGGERLTVHGHGFTHIWTVRVGGVLATHVQIISSTRLRITVPRHRPGTVHVRVATTHGKSSASQGRFTYRA